MSTLALQQLQIIHAPLLAELHAASFGVECWTKDQIESSLVLPTTQGWLAEYNGKAQGFIMCQVLEDEAEVLTFCVVPEARKNGIGRSLMKEVQAAFHEGYSLFLEVAEDNVAARHLYESCGFTENGIRRNYYQRGAERLNAINYVWFSMGYQI